MQIDIWLDSSSMPIRHEAEAVFTEGGLLCIRTGVCLIKYPLCRVHKVVHVYGIDSRIDGDEREPDIYERGFDF